MLETDVTIPADVSELKQEMGQAMLVEMFAGTMHSEPPDFVLRSARNGENVQAANAALASFSEQLDDLGCAAERALENLPRGIDDAMASWMSDLFGSYQGAQAVLRDIPGQYLGKLLTRAFKGEADFRRVMELFRDLARETTH